MGHQNKKVIARIGIAAVCLYVGLTAGCGKDAVSSVPEADIFSEVSGQQTETGSTLPAVPPEPAGTAEAEAVPEKFYIYSWDEELAVRLEIVYRAYPEWKDRIAYVNAGSGEVYREKVDSLLQEPDAEAYPDMIALDDRVIKEFVNSDNLLPVTQCGLTEADLSEMYPYTITIAMDQRNHELKGISWQNCPGAFIYRADIAETVLGVKSPEEMQDKVGTWEDFLETAREVKEKSGGAVRILPSAAGLADIVMFGRKRPWVTPDGAFHMDEAVLEYLDIAYALGTEELTWETMPGTDGWDAGFSGNEVLGYFGGTEFLHQSVEENCGGEKTGQGTFGLWNICLGPVAYCSGGTWLGATAECSDTALAGEILKALCCEPEILTEIYEETEDYINHRTMMEDFSREGKGTLELLGGQDYIEAFSFSAYGAEAFWKVPYDRKMTELLEAQAAACLTGAKDRDTAVSDLIKAVSEAFPEIIAE